MTSDLARRPNRRHKTFQSARGPLPLATLLTESKHEQLLAATDRYDARESEEWFWCRRGGHPGRGSSHKRCPTETDRAPATEIADRAGRSVGAASRQASGEGPNFGYRVQVLRLPCAFCGYRVTHFAVTVCILRLPCALERSRRSGLRRMRILRMLHLFPLSAFALVVKCFVRAPCMPG